MTRKELRPYQVEALDGLRGVLRGHRAALLVMPTGAGKTRSAAEMVDLAYKKGTPTLWLADRKELVEQASDAFTDLGIPHGLILPGHKPSEDELILCGTIQSFLARNRRGSFDPAHIRLIVLDEAHRAESRSYQELLSLYPNARVVGLTATPVRGDGKGLGRTFGGMVQPVSIRALMDEGYLVQPRYFVPSELDLIAAREGRGDYTQRELDAIANSNPQLIGDVVSTFARVCPDRRAVVFPCNIAHSRALEDAFNSVGIPAVHIDGQTPDGERQERMRAFREGEYQILTSVNIAIEGLDVPDVSAVVMARPTRSERIWIQCLDAETEILTPNGWTRIGEIQEGQSVYGLDTSSGAIKPVPALATFRRPLGAGEYMVGVQAPHLDIRVTDGHRMVYKSRSKTSKNWQIKTAGDLLARREAFKVPVSGIEEVEASSLTPAALQFIGLFLSDGTLDGGTISIAQSLAQPQWLHDRIVEVLNATGFGFRKVVIQRTGEHQNYAPVVHYKISKNKPKKGREGTGWKSVEAFITQKKHITDAYQSLNRDQVLSLLDGLWLGDGTKSQGDGWVKQTQTITFGSHYKTAEDIQSLCVRRGIRANLATHRPKPSKWNADPLPQAVLHYHPSKTTATIGTASSSNGSTPWQILPHRDGEEVWCVENELGTLITRRNGKVAILGNCVGRGLRSHPSKTDCVVLDHAGVLLSLGPAEDEREWELGDAEGKTAKTRKAQRKAPRDPKEITCEECAAVFYSARTCPHCGHVHAFERAPRDVEVGAGELQELTPQGRKQLEHTQEEKKAWWAGLQWYVAGKGWKPGAAFMMYKERFGVQPGNWEKQIGPAMPSSEVLAWIKHRNIKRAKAREKEQARNAAD